ncbi:hypothetical protein AAEX28_12555 [Lentisphaerota bacterium WC36G]|nr:hypothetical protein LJT99_15380 [Lentisphaerae bacterium WC36]
MLGKALTFTIGAGLGASFHSSAKRAKTVMGSIGKVYNKNVAKLGAINTVQALGKELKSLQSQTAKTAGEKKELDKQIRKAQKSLGKATTQAKKMGVTFDKTTLKSQKLWTSFKIGAAYTAKSIHKLGVGFIKFTGIIGGAVGSVYAMTAKLATSMDNIIKTAKKLNIGVEPLQELQHAAQLSGLEIGTFNTALEMQIKNIADAAKGTGVAVRAMEQLGLNAQDLNKLAPEQQMNKIADALKNVNNQNDKLRIAREIYGRSGSGMLNVLNTGSTGINKMRQDAQDTGNVSKESDLKNAEKFNDELLRFKSILTGLTKTVGSALMPVFSDMMIEFKNFFGKNKEQTKQWAKDFGSSLKDLLKGGLELLRVGLKFSKFMGNLINNTIGFKSAAVLAIGIIFGKVTGLFSILTPVIKWSTKALWKHIGGWQGFKDAVSKHGKSAFNFIKNGSKTSFTFLKKYGKSAFRGLGTGFKNLGGVFKTVGLGLWKGIAGLIPVLGTFFTTTIGFIWSTTVAMLACPITWIVLGIMAIIGVGFLLVKFWKPIKKFFIGVFKAIAWWALWPVMLIIKFWKPIKGFFAGIWDGIITGVKWCWNLLKGIFSWSPFALVTKAYGAMFNWLDKKFAIFKKIGSAWRKIKGWFGGGDKDSKEDDPREQDIISATKQAQNSSPAAMMSRNNQAQINNNQKISINIKPTKGMNEEKVAELAVQKIQEQNESNMRDSFNDYDETMV